MLTPVGVTVVSNPHGNVFVSHVSDDGHHVYHSFGGADLMILLF
jgi:hypothetical protein